MKNSMIIAGVAALSIGVAIAGDKKQRISQTVDLKDFEQISVSGVYDLTVTIGDDYSVVISGPAHEVERVEASVSDGVLDLGQKDGKRRWGRKRHGLDAHIVVPRLTGLTVSGVVDGTIDNIDAEKFTLSVSGVGDISLAGQCDSLNADVSGVGDLDARELECRAVDVKVSGVGSATVFAAEVVDAAVSGMGDIDVYGDPEQVSKSGSMFADVTVH